jgi:hypothetical protein
LLASRHASSAFGVSVDPVRPIHPSLTRVIAKAVTPAATVRRVRDQAGGVLDVAFGEEAELCARVYLLSARLLLPGWCGLRAST